MDCASDPCRDGLEEVASSCISGSPGTSEVSSDVSSATASRLDRLIVQLRNLHVDGGSNMVSPNGKAADPEKADPKPIDKSWVSMSGSKSEVVDLTADDEMAKTPPLTGTPSQRLVQFFKNKKKAERVAHEKSTFVPPESTPPSSSVKPKDAPKNEHVLPAYVA